MRSVILIIFLCAIGTNTQQLHAQNTDKDVKNIVRNRMDDGLRTIAGYTSDYDVNYHRLQLHVNPTVHYLNGSVTTYFKPKVADFGVIHFNLQSNMIVDSVVYHNSKITSFGFINTSTIQIVLPSAIPMNVHDSIALFYRGAPLSDGFGGFTTSTNTCGPNNGVMWTLSEPYGAKNWWPCKQTLDDKADSLDMIVTCPSAYRVAGNGVLSQEILHANNTKTYHWKHRYPIPTYLVAFAVADYSFYSNWVPIPGSPSIEVLNYVYSCNTTAATLTPDVIPMMQYYVDILGEYPFAAEKYGHAQCGFGGGMEHSTMSFMGGFNRLLLAHELAHQWFGDKITCGSWKDIWLNEGFATYMEGLTCEQGIGNTSWSAWKTNTINNVTGNNYGSTYVTDTTNISTLFSGRLVYNKGALILHMLRWKLGDAVFFQGLHDYIQDPDLSYSFAKSPDFQNIMETTSGMDLSEFFDDWLYGQGFPNYTIKWAPDPTCNKVYLTVTQSHSAGQGTFFEMPVPLRFSNGTMYQDVVVQQNNPSDTLFNQLLNFSPTSVSFDPDKWLCAKATVSQVAFNNHKVIVWAGTVDDNWHNAGNWDCGVPTANDDVVIPSSAPNCRIYSRAIANCRKLKVANASSLITESKAVLNIHN